MLEPRKRHLRKCPKHAPGSPFSADLDCKRCVYYAYGKLNGKKFRQSLDTTDRQEAASKLLQIEAEAKAPGERLEPVTPAQPRLLGVRPK